MVICVVVGSEIYKFAGHCNAQYGGKVTAYPLGNDRKTPQKGGPTHSLFEGFLGRANPQPQPSRRR